MTSSTLVFDQVAKEAIGRQGIWLNIPFDTYEVCPESTFEPSVLVTTLGYPFLPIHYGAFTRNWSPCVLTSVGRYCSIAHDVKAMAPEHPTTWLTNSTFPYFVDDWFWQNHLARTGQHFEFSPFHALRPIAVGNDVWIGTGAYLKGGISIGDGAVIGTNTVVTKDVPPYAIVVGNPGRVIRYRFTENIIERLLSLRWWRFDFSSLNGIEFSDPERAIEEIERRIEAEAITEYAPAPLSMRHILEMLPVWRNATA